MDLSVIWRLQDLMSAPVQKVIRTVQVAQRSLERANAGMSAGFRRTTGSVNELRNKIEGLKAYRDGLRVGVDTSAITRANKELQALHRQLEKVEKINARRDGSSGINKGMIAGVMSRYLPYLSATAAIAGVSGVAKMGMDREMDLSRFEQFIPNKNQAHQTFNELNKFGNDSIYRNSDVMRTGARVAEQFGANKVMSQMKMYGDLAGGDGFAMQGITRTMGQIKGVGHLQGDEMNELANHGILGLQTQIAKMKGVSVATFNKMKEAGKISFEDVQKAMEAMTSAGGKYFGYLDKVSNTTFGRIQKLIGTVQEKFTVLATTNLPTLNKLIDWANKFIDNFAPIGIAIKKFIQAFNPLWDAIYTIVKAMGLIPKSADGVMETIGLITTIFSKLGGVVQFVSSVIYNLVSVVQSLPLGDKIIQAMLLYGAFSQLNIMTRALSVSMAILTAVKGLGDIGAWLSLLRQIPFGAVTQGMKGLQLVWVELNAVFAMTPIGAIIISIVALVAAITYAWQNSEKFREVVIRTWEGIKNVWNVSSAYIIEKWNKVSDFFDKVNVRIVAGWMKVKEKASNIFNSLYGFIKPIIDWFREKFVDVWDKWGDKITGVFDRIVQRVKDLVKKIPSIAIALSVFDSFKTGYNSKTATEMVKKTEYLRKDRSETEAARNARRALRKVKNYNAGTGTSDGNTGAGGAGIDKASTTVSDTVEGTRSKNIVINIDKLIGTTNIYADKQNVGRSVQDEVIEALIRILSSGQPLAFE